MVSLIPGGIKTGFESDRPALCSLKSIRGLFIVSSPPQHYIYWRLWGNYPP